MRSILSSTCIHSRRITFALIAAATLGACASNPKETEGAVIGAAGGAVAGGVIGHQRGSTTTGAIIGAVVGGTAGAIIGHQMDQQAKELKQNIPGATVARVGEGISVTFASGLLFDFDKSAVKPDAATNLDNLAKSLDKYPNTQLLIVGYTDATGTADYNMTLSKERADAAAAYLVSQGVNPTRIQATGRGETEPLANNDTEAGRHTNRRVEVAIFADKAARSGDVSLAPTH
jgi:outer membrane protein OmpA-like peptidoglycan-associated protein